jgi:hypothetical protein
MAYTAPPTFVAADPLAASELNVLGDDIVYLYGVAAGVTWCAANIGRNAAQSIPDATDTDVALNAEYVDAGGWWSSGASLTVPAGAIPAGFTVVALQIIAKVNFAVNNTGIRRVLILKNGTEETRLTVNGLNGEATTFVLPTYITAAAGDTITMQVHQTSGGALNLSIADIWVVRFAPVS